MSKLFEHDDTFLARWLSGELNEEEMAEFKNSEDYHLYKKIADKSADKKTSEWDKDAIWQKIKTEGEVEFKREKPAAKKSKLRWLIVGTAASLLLVVGYWSRYMLTMDVYTTTFAEQKVVDLPDGSVVHLNADSEIRFCRKTFDEKRLIELFGEAFFEVEEGSTFKVETDNGEVRVLGTSFNVRARENRLDVNCYSGKVGVSFNDFEDEAVLTRGDVILSRDKNILNQYKEEEASDGPDWKQGRSVFKNVRFEEVIKELERQFDIQIKVEEDISNIENYNGGFPHDDLTTALNIVSESVNCEYQIQNKTVTLLKKG